MDYDAVMCLHNTFITVRLTNHDCDRQEVEEVAEHIADKLGATYLYTEKKPKEPAT